MRYDSRCMHVRASACRGLPICEHDNQECLATVFQPVFQPDTGHVEGFSVRVPGFARSRLEFLSSDDIGHWGLVIRIRHRDIISPLEERLRLREIVGSGRSILGQPIVTEQGRVLGRCADLQFETHFFQLEWLFPRRFWRWGLPIPARDIVEVRPDAVVVRERQAGVAEASVPAVGQLAEG